MDRNWIRGKSVLIVGNFDGVDKFLSYNLITRYNCKIIGVCSNQKNVDNFKTKLGEYSNNFSYEIFDICKESNWKYFSENLRATNCRIDVLINCDLSIMKHESFEDINQSGYLKSISTYYYPVIFSVRHLLNLIRESRVPTILCIFGLEAVVSLKGLSHYSAGRSAAKSFIEILANELEDIYVGTIYIGPLKHNKEISNDYYKNIRKRSMSLEKASNKIIANICKRKSRVMIGNDIRLFNIINYVSPKLCNKTICKYLKIKSEKK